MLRHSVDVGHTHKLQLLALNELVKDQNSDAMSVDQYTLYYLNPTKQFPPKHGSSLLHKSYILAIFASSSCSPTQWMNH